MTQDRFLYTAADANYSLQAKVLLHSLSATQVEKTHLTVFGSGWSASQISELKSQSFANVTVEVAPIDPTLHKSIRLTNGFPLATAYNVLAPQSLLPSGTRALYFDADVVVRRDLAEMFSMEMSHAVGSVIDAHVGVIGSPSMWRPWREEQIDPQLPYLNTGTLLIDVDRWNNEEITEKIVFLLEKYDLPCVDQDAINLVLRGKFDILRPAFNSMPFHLMKLLRTVDFLESELDIEEAICNPAVVHFHRSFLGKPWCYGSTHPAKSLWTEIADICEPRWRRKLDSLNWARGVAAKVAKMSVLDSRAISMKNLQLEANVA